MKICYPTDGQYVSRISTSYIGLPVGEKLGHELHETSRALCALDATCSSCPDLSYMERFRTLSISYTSVNRMIAQSHWDKIQSIVTHNLYLGE